MFAAFMLAAALATPTPTTAPAPTPPPEPNHITIAGTESFLQPSQEYWPHWSGVTSQISGMYEFQASARVRFADTLHWERLSSHYTSAFTGQATPFNFNEYDDEFDVELGRPQLPTGVGIGYYDYNPVYDFPRTYDLAGFGLGVDHWSNWYVPRSFYYSLWYYPSVSGSQPSAGAYGIARVDLGLNVRQSLVSPWGFRVGVQDESWFSHNGNALSKNFLGAYVSLTWWQ